MKNYVKHLERIAGKIIEGILIEILKKNLREIFQSGVSKKIGNLAMNPVRIPRIIFSNIDTCFPGLVISLGNIV